MLKRLTAAAVLLATSTAQAYLIDDFNDQTPTVVPGDGVPVYINYLPAMGGGRTITVEEDGLLHASAAVAGGFLHISSDSGTRADTLIEWVDAVGVDLTDDGASDRISLQVVGIDQGGVTMELGLTDLDGHISRVPLAGLGVGVREIMLTDFVNVDASRVTKVELLANSTDASDLVADFVTSSRVPTPGTLLLLGLPLIYLTRSKK